MTLRFREGDLLLKEYEPGDEVAILESFNRIFAAIDKYFVPRSLEAWRWQYLANPSGGKLVSAFTPEGVVVAHHGFILQRLRVGTQTLSCGQVVDTLVDASYRRGLQRVSLSALLSHTFVDHFGGEGPDRVAFFWGAPIRVAMRVGESQGRYEMVRTQLKLVASPATVVDAVDTGVTVAVVERFSPAVDALFEAMAPGFGAIAVRDRAQLDWRFADRPGFRYRIAEAWRAGRLVGYAVFAKGHFDGRDNQGLVCDWLVDRADLGAQRALLGWLLAETRREQAEQLVAIVPDSCAEWAMFQDLGLRVQTTHYPFVSWTCARRFVPEWLRWNWYYTLGDTDLV